MQEILSNILKDTLTTIYESLWVSLIISILVMFFLLFAYNEGCDKERGIKATMKFGLNKLKTSSSYRRLFFFVFYVAMLLHLTLLGRSIWPRPFQAVFSGWTVYTRWGLNVQPIENVMLFIPFTILLFYALADRILDRGGLPAVLLKSVQVSGGVSISIEVLQGILHLGTLQISDTFYNVVGGVIGGLIYWCGHSLVAKQNQEAKCEEMGVKRMTVSEKDFITILNNAVHPKTSQTQLVVDDFGAAFSVASNQNLLPLIYNSSSEYAGFTEFDEAHPEYMMTTMKLMGTQVQNTANFLSLYKEFLNTGLAPVVVKGIICRNLYGELQDFRLSGDEDILIEKKDYEAAVSVLSSCGYKSNDVADNSLSTVQEVTFYNIETGLTVELHLNPFGEDNQIRSKMNTWFGDSFSTTEILDVDGVRLRVLSPTDNLLFLLFHAFKHFLSAGMGIRMALDILLCMEKYQESIDWDYVITPLEDVKAVSFTADLIAVGNEYLGFNIFVEGMSQPTSPDELLDDMLRMGTFGVGSQVDADASRFTEAAVEGKSSSKVADTFHLVFPSWNQWKGFKPYLVDRPWMLPIEWCRRVGRYLKKRNKVDFSESRKVADRRIELMKKYGVI